MRTPWSLVRKQLTSHWIRSGLSIAAITLAMFLFCFVRSIVTTLDNAVSSAATNRLVVQSAVSLFVDLPLDYQQKVAGVSGVEAVSKMNWFGGEYVFEGQEQFFAQFAVDETLFFDMYAKEMLLGEGPGGVTGAAARQAVLDALAAERRGCVVGRGAATRYGWEVGDMIPIQPRIFAKPDESAWEFVICGIYDTLKDNVDDQTLYYRWDYHQQTVEAELGIDELGVGVFMVNLADGVDPDGLIAQIDGLFENGPRKTVTTTEAAFQAMFVSMLGSLPEYTAAIGGAIVFAVFFSVVNTMLLAARQRRRSDGILKALGFGNSALVKLLLVEALVLSVGGGALGIGLAKGVEEPMRVAFGPNLPGYAVANSTMIAGLVITLAIGVVAGLGPALGTVRRSAIDSMRSEG